MRRWVLAAAVVVMLAMAGGAVGEVPDPINLQNTTGTTTSAYWVNHTWQTGGGAWYLISGVRYGAFEGFNGTGSAWQSDSGIVSGLPEFTFHSAPTTFQKDGTWYLISGDQYGAFEGFNWTGSAWQSDSGIVSDLLDVGDHSAPTVFQKDGTWYLISGVRDGAFEGFNWTGSAWQSDSGIVSGLGDIGRYSAPTVFQKDGTWYLISGEEWGAFIGFNWTGSAWQSDSGIVSDLLDVGDHSATTVFQKDGTWYLIAGGWYGTIDGFNWTGSAWQSDNGIVSGLGDIELLPKPMVFDMAADTTDSYNVSVNGVWHNSTIDTFWDGTYPGHTWQNITVYAWNGVLSVSNVSQNTKTTGMLPAAWWDDDWDYRQRITIDNTQPGDLNDSYVEVIVNASQCYWSDCSDMRFINASSGLEIDFYCDADIGGFPNTTTTEKIYLKVPHIPGNGEAHIDFYFGNINSVPNKCSGSGTLAFTETFSDEDGYLDRWYPDPFGSYEVLPGGQFRGKSWNVWTYAPDHLPDCIGDNFDMKYGYYGARRVLVQPAGAEIRFVYNTIATGNPPTMRSYLLFGCNDDKTVYSSLIPNTHDVYALPATMTMNFQMPSYGDSAFDPTMNVYIDDIQLVQDDTYMPPHAVGAVEMRSQPYIVLYDSSGNLVQHAQVTIQNTDTGAITERWKDVDNGIIDMGATTETFQVTVRTFDGVFVHTCDLGATPICNITLPIHYNLRVYPVDEQQKPLTDVFAGLAEYTPLDPQAFWGYSMTGSLYVPVTNCSGFAMCDLIAEKGGYESYNETALNWTSRSALVKDYRHTAVLAKEN